MIDAGQTNFEREVIAASREMLVLVDFWAPWCGPCRMLGPVLERLESTMAGQFKLVKVNSDESPALSAEYGVRSIPYVVAFRDGAPVDQFVGALPEGQIRAFLDRLLPKPGESMLSTAAQCRERGDLAGEIDALRAALAVNPALEPARIAYVRALVRDARPGDAEQAFAPLVERARTDRDLAALAVLIEAAKAAGAPGADEDAAASVAAAPDDLERRYRYAKQLIAQSRWQPAMDELLGIIVRDRGFHDDQARKDMIAVFALCDDRALVSEYRRRLGAALN